MSASLVGSEMCIRDRPGRGVVHDPPGSGRRGGSASRHGRLEGAGCAGAPVSYTHLTLPTDDM
eukprot:1289870-Alexandrium_andersonii.AAC.1